MAPPGIRYVLLVLVPVRPSKFSAWQFVLNQIQVLGFSQFTKMSFFYIAKKFLSIQKSGENYSVKKLAKNKSIDLISTRSLKNPELLDAMKRYDIDIILSVASSRIFGKEILSVPKIACLNVHSDKLPKYRGVNPSFWSLLNQEKQSAVTVHFVNEGIDDGDIIIQDVFNIQESKSLHDVYVKVLKIAPSSVTRHLK